MPTSYDSKCADLARSFLEDENAATEANVDTLAQLIQDAIEMYIGYQLPRDAVAGAQPPSVAGEDNRARPASDSEVSTDERFLRVTRDA